MPVAGTILGGTLRLERLAGTSGMGTVFDSRDLTSGQRVAVKLLRCSQPDPMVRFEREVRILAELDHPNIVRYLDHGVALLGQPYVVMEWLDGEDLAARLRRGPLTVRETLAIGRDVAEALAATHARGITHRDLAPGNVFLTRGQPGTSKLLGFGIAQLGGRAPVTPTGALLGGYLAPEQAQHRANPTPAADVFSLGCVLFECLAGRPVFAGEHPGAAIDEVLASTLPSLTRLRPNVPGELAALIQRMLAREPAQRPCDGAAVRAALVALAASQAPGVEPDTAPAPAGCAADAA
jgi:eukaryotic-like serine/threonine-protein kinase